MGEYKHCFVKEKILNLEGNGPLKRGLKRDLNGSLKVSHLCIFFKFPVFRFFVVCSAVAWVPFCGPSQMTENDLYGPNFEFQGLSTLFD